MTKLVVALATIISIAVGFFKNAGLLSLWGLLAPIDVLKKIDWALFKKELGEVDPQERAQLEASFNSALKCPEPIQSKLVQSVGLMDKVIVLAEKGFGVYNTIMGLKDEALAIVAEFKQIVGLAA